MTVDQAAPDYYCDAGAYFQNALDAWSYPPKMLFFSRGHLGLLWAPIIRVFGQQATGPMLLNVVLGVWTVYALYRIVRLLTGRARTALIAAGALAVYPSHVLYARELLTEVPFTALALTGLLFLARLLALKPGENGVCRGWAKEAALAGLFFGLGHWIRPLGIVFWAVGCVWLVLVLFTGTRRSLWHASKAIVVVTTAFAASIAWLICANYRLQGSLSPSYMQGRGFTFLAGTVRYPRGPVHKGADKLQTLAFVMFRNAWREQTGEGFPPWAQWDRWGHKRYQGFASDMAWQRIRRDIPGFLIFAATEKMCMLWHGDRITTRSTGAVLDVAQASFSFLVTWAIIAMLFLVILGPPRQRDFGLALLASMIVAACSSLHFVVYSNDRYHFYCIPPLIALVLVGAERLVERSRRGQQESEASAGAAQS